VRAPNRRHEPSWEKAQPIAPQAEAIDLRQIEASTRSAIPATLRSVGVDGWKISFLQVWVVLQNLILGHTRREHIQHVPDGDSKPTNARLPRPLPGQNCDP